MGMCDLEVYKICTYDERIKVECGNNVKAIVHRGQDTNIWIQARDDIARLHTSDDCSGHSVMTFSPTYEFELHNVSYFGDQIRSVYLPPYTIAELIPTEYASDSKFRRQDVGTCVHVNQVGSVLKGFSITY